MIFILLQFSFNSYAQIQIELKTETNDKKAKKIIKQNSNAVDSLNADKKIQSLIAQFQSLGYLEASVDELTWVDSSHIVANLNTGRKYQWGVIHQGNLPLEVLKQKDFKTQKYIGKPLTPQKYQLLLSNIVKYYENNGYPFVKVKLDSISFDSNSFDSNSLSGTHNIKRYDKIIFDTVYKIGDSKISTNYVSHYLGIYAGDNFNQALLLKSDKLLDNLLFISRFNETSINFTPLKSDVYLFINKKKANTINGIIGLTNAKETETSTNQKIQITGELNLGLINSFSKGEEINFHWQKLEKSTQSLHTSLVYPYIFKSSAGVDISFQLYKYDTIYINTNPVFGIRFYQPGGNYFRIFLNQQKSSIISLNKNAISQTYPEYNAIIYGAGGYWSNLDYKLNPRKGFNFMADIGLGTKTSDYYLNNQKKEVKFSQREGISDLHIFVPILSRSTILFRNQLGFKISQIISSDTLYSDIATTSTNEMFQLGGTKTIRGFDEMSILASKYLINTLEYRYVFDKNSSFFLFADYMVYETIQQNITIHDTPVGFGTGIHLETNAGIFSFTYALGKQFDNPIEFRNAKIHLGYVNRF